MDCATVEFGCVEVGADEPINLGAAQVISGADATLGQDQVNAIELAIDHLDGTFDQTPGTLLDHPVNLTTEDELCSAEGGQTAGTALAADASIVAVIGTSCSSAALGVADTILGDKGITLISGSNTSPALTDPALHNPFYARTAHNDRIQGAIGAEFALGEDLGATTAATIADESPYTQGLVACVRGELRGWGRHPDGIGAGQLRGHRLQAGPQVVGRTGSRRPVLPDLRGSLHADHQAGAGHHARRRADRG